jgi:glutamate-1-semialdehyde 2,1-aminomutase
VAALATLRKHRRLEVAGHLVEVGLAVREGWRRAAIAAGLEIHVSGIAPLGHFSFAADAALAKTYFTQAMLDRGFLATSSFYSMLTHTHEHVARYLEAVEQVFAEIVAAQLDGTLARCLRGPIVHTGFARLTG